MIDNNSVDVKEDVLLEETTDHENSKQLVVYNDDFNTFDHVIDTLIRICKHSQQQAEQCTMLIHFKGKCTVKSGDYKKLKPMKQAILDAGINVVIE